MTDPIATLLPCPKQVERAPGACPLGHLVIEDRSGDPRIEKALSPFRSGRSENAQTSSMRVAVDNTIANDPGAYAIRIAPDHIDLIGASPRGCYHGIATLTQLAGGRAVDAGTQPPEPLPGVALPCCRIVDEPDFKLRGLLHDVTRGKVPTVDTLMRIVDRLAAMKISQLQLNIEHAFAFTFDPDICDETHGLTPDETRSLSAYARDRFVDVVPAVATLGHMGRILSMPRYRHLAEIQPEHEWAQMSWHQRMAGCTLNCMDPHAHRLVEDIWTDILDAFDSPVVNICGDEPWDLGQGRSAARVEPIGKGEAYLQHIRRTHDFCAARGRHVQFWSDIIRNHPELIGALPPDIAVLHWGYDDNTDYDGLEAFTHANLSTVACPGTSGWKRIINAMDLAERNIQSFAQAGRRHRIDGLLNTDWGDHGHFNALACSWHAIALGAALGWSADHATGAHFDEVFATQFIGEGATDLIGHLRTASRVAGTCETWRLMWQPMDTILDDPSIPGVEALEEAHDAAARARAACTGGPATGKATIDLAELDTACAFTQLFVEKMRTARARAERDTRKMAHDFGCRLNQALEQYATCWLRRNKPGGLEDIRKALCALTP